MSSKEQYFSSSIVIEAKWIGEAEISASFEISSPIFKEISTKRSYGDCPTFTLVPGLTYKNIAIFSEEGKQKIVSFLIKEYGRVKYSSKFFARDQQGVTYTFSLQ